MSSNRHLILEDLKLGPAEEWSASTSEAWCFLRVAAGVGYAWIRSAPREIADGEVLAFRTGERIHIRASQIGEFRINYFLFVPSLLIGFLNLREIACLGNGRENGQTTSLRHYARTHPCAQLFAQVAVSRNRRETLLFRGQILQIVGTAFAEELALPPADGQRSISAGRRFAEVMEQLPADKIRTMSPRELALLCRCSERHFNRLFQSCFKGSIRSRQVDLRLEKARDLLLETTMPISLVAQESGFSNINLFNRHFKKRFGESPRRWRDRQHRAPG